jgi:hypothetical protein
MNKFRYRYRLRSDKSANASISRIHLGNTSTGLIVGLAPGRNTATTSPSDTT